MKVNNEKTNCIIGNGDIIGACTRKDMIGSPNYTVTQKPMGDTLNSGMLVTRDAGHPTNGIVHLLKKVDGSLILQFDKFSKGTGPDIDILVSTAESYSTSGIVKIDDPKYSGSFYVNLPKQINPNEYHTVMIWCEAYDILFATCKLQ